LPNANVSVGGCTCSIACPPWTAAAKARGAKLGGSRGFIPRDYMRAKATEALGKRVAARLVDIAPEIQKLQERAQHHCERLQPD
jgi:hypothetical protein